MPFFDNVPNIPGIKQCSNCKRSLVNLDFKFIGVSCSTPSKLFFDYKCECCGFEGRWTYGLIEGEENSPVGALKTMIEVIKFEEDEQRGIMQEKLNKVHGISDLLKLGEKDAPRERKNKKGR